MDRDEVTRLQGISAQAKPFFEAAERAIVLAEAETDAQGWVSAMDRRALLAWLVERVKLRGDRGYPAIPWQACLSLRMTWEQQGDNHPELQRLYDDWARSGRDASVVLARLTGSS